MLMVMHLAQAQRSGTGKARARSKALPFICAAALLLGTTGFGFAQTAAGAAGTGATGTDGGAVQTNPASPNKAPPSSPEVTGANNGIITPKRDVDPGMSKAPPQTGSGSMPVVKPKGTPGGAPGPEPK